MEERGFLVFCNLGRGREGWSESWDSEGFGSGLGFLI